MFDTMTLTKITGAFCGAFLVFLVIKWVADDGLYPTHASDGHGDDHHQAYVIDTGEEEGGEEVVEEAVDFTALMAAADAGKGERVFGKCKACHKLDEGAHGTGPSLYAVMGSGIGDADGYSYSEVLAGNDDAWTVENMYGFLENPKGWAPGTKMGFSGLKKSADRANVIAYLQGVGG